MKAEVVELKCGLCPTCKESYEDCHAAQQLKAEVVVFTEDEANEMRELAEKTRDSAEELVNLSGACPPRKCEHTDDLLLELEQKEKSYGRGKQHRPLGAYLASNQIFSAD